MTTTTLRLTDVDLVYDVHGPLPTPDGRPPLVLIGQPMDAGGFASLVAELTDTTTVTYDPRGLGRSTRSDGRVDHDPAVHADDVAALIDALAAGPVDLFASSGGAVTALALVARHPTSVRTLIAHEPPLLCLLDDADAALRAEALVGERYQASGWAAGMASFLAMTAWQGPFTEDYFDQPDPDPAQFGMPAGDDGTRDDPLLSGRSAAVTAFRPDVDALHAAPTRIVIAVGEESLDVLTGRTALATAALLGQTAAVFPSHHGGFMGGEHGYAGQPAAFAARLREVLAS